MAESRVTLTDSAADGRREEPYSGRTAWIRNLEAPVRDFLRTETGGAAVLVSATVASSRAYRVKPPTSIATDANTTSATLTPLRAGLQGTVTRRSLSEPMATVSVIVDRTGQ